MDKNIWLVYTHKRNDNGDIFFVGRCKGSDNKRPYVKYYRNKLWNEIVKNTDFEVNIIKSNLTNLETTDLINSIIEAYGLVENSSGTLVNLKYKNNGLFRETNLEKLKVIFNTKNYKSTNNFVDFIDTRSILSIICENGHKFNTVARYILHNNSYECKECVKESKSEILNLNVFNIDKKICNVCLEEKSKNEFGKTSKNKDGKQNTCKLCNRKFYSFRNNDLAIEKGRLRMEKYMKNNPLKFILQRCKSNHKKKGFIEKFNIDEEYLRKLYDSQNGKCYWSNSVLNLNVGHGDLNTLSIDRLDCNKGYVIGNIVLCTKFMNMGRGNTSIEEFKLFLTNLLG